MFAWYFVFAYTGDASVPCYTSGRRGWKRVLLFIQFGGAAFILGMMLVVFIQYNYATGRDRGFRPERVAYVYQRLEIRITCVVFF